MQQTSSQGPTPAASSTSKRFNYATQTYEGSPQAPEEYDMNNYKGIQQYPADNSFLNNL